MRARCSFSLLLKYLVFSICTLFVFSCPKKAAPDLYSDCYLTIFYKYNPTTDKVEEGRINRILYKGYIIGNDLEDLSNGLWKSNSEYGYGYYDYENRKQYGFYPNHEGAFEFTTPSGETWTTNDPLPSGIFQLEPKYVTDDNPCEVYLHYKEYDMVSGDVIDVPPVKVEVPYATRLSNFKGGNPEGWTDGKWKPNKTTNRYQYTYEEGKKEITKYLKFTNSGSSILYYFSYSQDGPEEFVSDRQILEPVLHLYAVYLDASKIEIKINYKLSNGYNAPKDMTLICEITKGDSLKDTYKSSEPKDWGDNSWRPFGDNEEYGKYEFVVEKAGDESKGILYRLRTGTEGIQGQSLGYLFTNQKGDSIYPGSPLTEPMTLRAEYEQIEVQVVKKIVFKYYANANDSKKTKINKEFKVLFHGGTSQLNSFKFDIEHMMELHEPENSADRLVYGYVDYSKHFSEGDENRPGYLKAYYYNKNLDGKFYLKYKISGQDRYCDNIINLSNFNENYYEFEPDYIDAGFMPFQITLCNGRVKLNFVLIPASYEWDEYNDEFIFYSWPYSQKNSKSPKSSSYSDDYDNSIDNYIDDMFVSQFMMSQKDAAIILAEANRLGYKFTEKATSSLYGLEYSTEQYVPWNYMTMRDAMVFCNLLTRLYNETLDDESDEYDPTYMIISAGGTLYEYKDATEDYGSISKGFDNTIFRIPTLRDLEYSSRIITDLRQLPENKKYVLSPFKDSNVDVQDYFQTAKNDTSNYYGSGAGLAYYDSSTGTYNTSRLREGWQAIGHRIKIVDSFNASVRQKVGRDGKIDYNMRNGAKLFNMSGLMNQLTESQAYDFSKCIIKGGTFKDSSTDSSNRIGSISSVHKASPSDAELATTGLRVVFYAKWVVR